MRQSEIKDFTQGNISTQLVIFAWPLFLSNLLQVVYNMVDMIVVGNVLGKVGISAVSIGGDISNLLTFAAMGFANAGQVLIARYIGARQRDRIGRFVGTMTSFLMVCAVLISVAALLFQDTLLRLMNTPPESYTGAASYSTICMVGLVFIYGYNVVSAILRGMGDSKHPFIFVSIAAVTNLILDIVFVLFMHMGPEGAALATVISQAFSFVACTLFLMKNRSRFELDITRRDFFHWDLDMLSSLVKLGVPMAIKSASIQISKLFVNSWINSYGVAVSAFAGIANKINSISNLVSNALNTAGSTMVGQNLAAGKFSRVKEIMVSIAKIGLSIAAIISLAIVVFPQQIFGLFTDDSSVLEIAGGYIPIAVLLFFGSASRAIMNALLNGSGNYRMNFAVAILDGIIMRVGWALIFGLVLDMKHYGFWLGDAVAGFTPFFIGLAFYWSGSWKKGKAVAEDSET
ncbi:MAG: MATE family efflux transporter [Firmicutes bacterium]|nr:MATE family efflux transporter [Bacillota bacterium]MBR2001446.1 MATE family efflux transporter [Bacillota bacterium]MBR4074063.1 MATE family efflux transporter [Bacillota bacterium]MBR7149265.1 MATE family efflux transporter [Bacillota bacterium]